MKRIIVNYADNVPTNEVLMYVQKVIEGGRISGNGESFCYVVTFKDDTVCASDITQTGTDVFKVWREQDND